MEDPNLVPTMTAMTDQIKAMINQVSVVRLYPYSSIFWIAALTFELLYS